MSIANYIRAGMEIYFSVDNNKEILRIPYVPPDVTFVSPLEYELFENSKGEYLSLIGEEGLRQLTLESWFPSRLYRWLGTATLAPICIDFFKRNRTKTMRVVVVSLSIQVNMLCKITDFTYRKKNNGDISYTLSIEEYIDPRGGKRGT
ncbi:MAG: hypothetical protein ACRCXX_09890 [Cetobacterium sp.]|uniref:hypothetical protein n=1 Tax=Cetobacterium sp. TaxID=2071632 RepID=UPI003F3B88A9